MLGESFHEWTNSTDGQTERLVFCHHKDCDVGEGDECFSGLEEEAGLPGFGTSHTACGVLIRWSNGYLLTTQAMRECRQEKPEGGGAWVSRISPTSYHKLLLTWGPMLALQCPYMGLTPNKVDVVY